MTFVLVLLTPTFWLHYTTTCHANYIQNVNQP